MVGLLVDVDWSVAWLVGFDWLFFYWGSVWRLAGWEENGDVVRGEVPGTPSAMEVLLDEKLLDLEAFCFEVI